MIIFIDVKLPFYNELLRESERVLSRLMPSSTTCLQTRYTEYN